MKKFLDRLLKERKKRRILLTLFVIVFLLIINQLVYVNIIFDRPVKYRYDEMMEYENLHNLGDYAEGNLKANYCNVGKHTGIYLYYDYPLHYGFDMTHFENEDVEGYSLRGLKYIFLPFITDLDVKYTLGRGYFYDSQKTMLKATLGPTYENPKEIDGNKIEEFEYAVSIINGKAGDIAKNAVIDIICSEGLKFYPEGTDVLKTKLEDLSALNGSGKENYVIGKFYLMENKKIIEEKSIERDEIKFTVTADNFKEAYNYQNLVKLYIRFKN